LKQLANPNLIKRSVITIAVGKPYYLQLAENLLRSFLLWNNENDIHFLLITDNADFYLNYKNVPKVDIRQITLGESEKSFTAKFKLFEYADAEENLFIDCDCLVYKDLDDAFSSFSQNNFSAIGNTITQGDFFCDVQKVIAHFKLKAMPKFVGAIYYFKKNEIARQVFDTAIELKNKYDELGFVRLRGKENEEPLFAVSLALAGECLVSNTGAIKADLMYYKDVAANISKGKTMVSDPIVSITGGEAIPDKSSPAILHFNASFTDGYLYKSEIFRLNHQKLNKQQLDILTAVQFKIPGVVKNAVKSIFRPVFHLVWNPRTVSQTDRI